MTAMRQLRHRFATFLRDEDGLILAESLIMLPLLIWAMVAMFIYWDVFRTINVTQKAAYGIADLLSRQRDTISLNYANGLQNIMDFLTPGGHPVKMRITSIQYVAATGKYKLLFSFSPNSKAGKATPLTETEVQAWKGTKVPTLNDGESVFVLETEVAFKTQMKTVLAGLLIGVDDGTYGQFIVTRPRHRRLCLEGTTTCT